MRLHEALEKANDNDKIRHDWGGLEFFKKDITSFYMSARAAVSVEWQIIPAEPKVLTAEQIVDSVNNEYVKIREEDFLTYQTAIQIAKLGQKNGRLERDLQSRPLVESIQKYIDDDNIQWHKSGIEEALQNLKPLNNGEK